MHFVTTILGMGSMALDSLDTGAMLKVLSMANLSRKREFLVFT